MLMYDPWEGWDPYYEFVGTGSAYPGAGVTVTVPHKQIELPGGISIDVGGGEWTIDPRTGGSLRELAVSLTNQFELALQQNLAKYKSGELSASQALSNFDRIWQEYTDTLNAVGEAEKARAIADRQRGGKFDWFTAYRDPIRPGVGIIPIPNAEPSLLSPGLMLAALLVAGLVILRK